MGIKAHDCFTAALCQSCHHELDQGKNLSREQREDLWMDAWKKLYCNFLREAYLSQNEIQTMQRLCEQIQVRKTQTILQLLF